MAGFGFIKPKAVSVNAADIGTEGLTKREKFLMLAAALRDDQQGLQSIPLLAAARAQQARQATADKEFATAFSGSGGLPTIERKPPNAADLPKREAAPASGGLNLSGLPMLPDAPQIDAFDVSTTPYKPRADAKTMLAMLARNLNDPNFKNKKDLVELSRPDLMEVNGRILDKHDGDKAGQFFGKPPVDGAEPAFNGRGDQIGWRMMDGSLQAMTQSEEAKALGKTRGDLVEIPMLNGRVRKMTGAAFLDGRGDGGGAGEGLGIKPSDAETKLATGRAETEVGREADQPKAFAGLQDQARVSSQARALVHELLGDSYDPKSRTWAAGGGSGLIGDAGDILSGGFTTGLGANLAGLNGTKSHDLQTKLETLSAITKVEELQKMRANSPTGGALGAVSDSENRMLSSLRGSLDQGQSADQLKASLRSWLDQTDEIAQQRADLYRNTYPAGTHRTEPAGPTAPRTSGKGWSIRKVGE